MTSLASHEAIDALAGKPFRRVRALLRVPRAARYRLRLQSEPDFLTVTVTVEGAAGGGAPLVVESSAGFLATSSWVTLDPGASYFVLLERRPVPRQELTCVSEVLWAAHSGQIGSSSDPSAAQQQCAKAGDLCSAVKCIGTEPCVPATGSLDETLTAALSTVYLKGGTSYRSQKVNEFHKKEMLE